MINKPILFKEVMAAIDTIQADEVELAEWLKSCHQLSRLEKIPGDASTRRYYRAYAGSTSFIAMKMEPFQDQGVHLPFIEVAQHLTRKGVDVPKIEDLDPGRGFILLEDLGDVTLLRKLQEVKDPETEKYIYQAVIDRLVDLQVNASSQAGIEGIEAFKLRFDFEKLFWEINFTIDHLYLQHLKRDISARDLKIMNEGFSEICRVLAEQPTVFTHRDFHSRNVMVCGADMNRYVMIDFQDARLGPPQYDLASLLKDSYYQLDDSQVNQLIDYYLARTEAKGGQRVDAAHFKRIFDLMSVQRNFKAIGSFASFSNRRGVQTYLKFIGNTFENIRRTLLKYPEYHALREVLFHYYYF